MIREDGLTRIVAVRCREAGVLLGVVDEEDVGDRALAAHQRWRARFDEGAVKHVGTGAQDSALPPGMRSVVGIKGRPCDEVLYGGGVEV